MTPGMTTALSQRRVTIAGLIKIVLPGHTVRLCDGSASIVFDGETYTGKDDVFGVIESIDAIGEAVGDTMPALALTVIPPPDVAAADCCNAAMQGSQVRVWMAAVDADTGLVVPDPELLFAGELDTASLETEGATRRINLEVVSVFERLFEPDEGARLADSFHQWVHPGELGFDQMTGTPVDRLWGPGERNGGATVVGTGGGGSGGGFNERQAEL
jgi:hypothetical protein